MVTGRNIVAEQKEPNWTVQQMKLLKSLSATSHRIMPVTETGRSVMDTDEEYLERDSQGTIISTEKAYFFNLEPNEYCIVTMSQNYDTT